MGTRRNPGQFDCLAKLVPDEPYFLLRGSDPAGHYLAMIWQHVYAGETCEALAVFAMLCNDRTLQLNPQEQEKLMEAALCADAMNLWANAKMTDRLMSVHEIIDRVVPNTDDEPKGHIITQALREEALKIDNVETVYTVDENGKQGLTKEEQVFMAIYGRLPDAEELKVFTQNNKCPECQLSDGMHEKLCSYSSSYGME